jgi:hypothetical protein
MFLEDLSGFMGFYVLLRFLEITPDKKKNYGMLDQTFNNDLCRQNFYTWPA